MADFQHVFGSLWTRFGRAGVQKKGWIAISVEGDAARWETAASVSAPPGACGCLQSCRGLSQRLEWPTGQGPSAERQQRRRGVGHPGDEAAQGGPSVAAGVGRGGQRLPLRLQRPAGALPGGRAGVGRLRHRGAGVARPSQPGRRRHAGAVAAGQRAPRARRGRQGPCDSRAALCEQLRHGQLPAGRVAVVLFAEATPAVAACTHPGCRGRHGQGGCGQAAEAEQHAAHAHGHAAGPEGAPAPRRLRVRRAGRSPVGALQPRQRGSQQGAGLPAGRARPRRSHALHGGGDELGAAALLGGRGSPRAHHAQGAAGRGRAAHGARAGVAAHRGGRAAADQHLGQNARADHLGHCAGRR
eukprot:scaffold7339_cov249-Pinguiococcus_pyrenoidosus.AAC.6